MLIKRKNLKARSIIVHYLADNVLEVVKNKTAKKIMEALAGTYKKAWTSCANAALKYINKYEIFRKRVFK